MQQNIPDTKVENYPNRAEARYLQRLARGENPRRVRSGVRTGTTAHFTEWSADLQVRSALQRMKLDQLAEQLSGTDSVTAGAFAVLRVNGKIKTVWQLARSNKKDLLDIRDIGPARLKAVETYLTQQRVKLDWTMF